MGRPARTALVASHTLLHRDPRVRREVEWLVSDGWEVDTLGLGAEPLAGVRRHFQYMDEPAWLRSMTAKGLIHALLTNGLKYRILSGWRIPGDVPEALRSGDYGLVIVNDIHLLPMIQHLPAGSRVVHIDLHEFHPPHLSPALRGGALGKSYRKWSRAFITSPLVRSRSTVARGIAALYRDDLGIDEPAIIRNCPPYEELSARHADRERVDLVYHGTAAWERGLGIALDAMHRLPERVRLNLILVGDEATITRVREQARDLGDRVRLLPPVPVRDIATRINEFDLEVMFYPPATENLRLALPNKLFEAIQARIGVVIGESPMMVEIVEEYGNGVIVTGWDATDLATAIEAITPEDIARYKKGSDRAAADLNAEHEREAFLAIADTFEP